MSAEERYERDAREERALRQRSRRRRSARDFDDEADDRPFDPRHDDRRPAYRLEPRYEPQDDRLSPERGRKPERRGPRGDHLSEDRVSRILDDALEAMQDSLRANEDRTADAIADLARRLETRPAPADNRVRAMRSDIERGFLDRAEEQAHPEGRDSGGGAGQALAQQLEQRISNVVSLIEQRAKPTAARQAAEVRAPEHAPADRSLERQIAALGQRIEQLAQQDKAKPQPADGRAAQELRQADRALERQIAALGERIEALASQVTSRPSERPPALRPEMIAAPIERLREEIGKLNATQHKSQPLTDHLIEALRALDAKVGRLAASGGGGGLSAVEGQLHSLGDRLDALTDKVAALRLSSPRDLRAQKSVDAGFAELKGLIQRGVAPGQDGPVIETMRALGRRLDALDRPQPALVQTFDRVQAIERKLDNIQRTPPELAARLDQLDRLEALERKLDAMQAAPAEIAERLDDIRAIVSERPRDLGQAQGVESALAALAARVERLHQEATDHGAFERLHAEVQTIGRKLDAAAAGSGEQDPIALDRIRGIEAKLDALQAAPAELAHRLDQIQSMMQTAPAPAGVPQGIETLLRNLALRLESMQSNAVDDRALDRLHGDIRQISQKLEASPVAQQAQGLADVGGLERSISELFGQLEQLRAEVGSTAEQAARTAADAVLARAPASRDAAPDESVRRQLTDIHAAQQEAERRANATLSAVHETLTRVVDRLVDLEQDIKARPAATSIPTAPVAQPASAVRPAASAEPVVAQPLPALGAAPRAEAPALSVASLRSQRLGVSPPTVAPPAAPKPGIGNMLAAARGAVSGLARGKDRAEPTPAAAPETPPEPAGAPAPPAASLDLPLEPGSGRPRGGQRAPAIDSNDPKASFLAAARRAAQAAAEQSAEALAETTAAKGQKKPAVPRKNLSKKQVILLGMAAVVVAVGASLQVMQSPPKVEPQPEKMTNLDRLFGKPAASEPKAAEPKAADPRSADARPGQGAAPPPRQILPSEMPAQAKPDDRVMTQPTRAAQPNGAFLPPDPSTVGAIASEAPRAPEAAPPKAVPVQPLPAVSNDPLLRFEGVVGAERLKTAARAGDPAAFIELGNRHLEGRGAPRDARTAALWFERAADFGSAPAQFRLGAMYREGRGVERNPRMAIKHFQAAAEAGNARGMYNAAVLLAEGVNGTPDYAAAGEWFKKAAEFGIRDAQYNLAILYARGLGLPQDLVASYAWFSAAAASGDEDAAKKRDEVAARLPADRLAQAKAAASAWKPKTPDPASNEVSVPAGGWDGLGAKQVPAAALGEGRKARGT